MKLITFSRDSAERLGAIVNEGCSVLDLLKAANEPTPEFASMQALIESGEAGLARARSLVAKAPKAALLRAEDVNVLAPLPRPIKMRDCQLYHEHIAASFRLVARKAAENSSSPEASYKAAIGPSDGIKPILRERVIYYNVDRLAMAGPEDEIQWPAESDWMDYELEWAVVVGRTGRNISAEAARDFIFGYTIFNDLSARDIQLRVMEATLGPGAGKDFDKSNSIGPCIVTKDEFDDPYSLLMTARVNGEEWSRGST